MRNELRAQEVQDQRDRIGFAVERKDFEKDPAPVHILYAERKPMPVKLRVFLDWLTPRLKSRLAQHAERPLRGTARERNKA